MSVDRNHARFDLQMYVEIPDGVLDAASYPGLKLTAMHYVRKLLEEAVSPLDLVDPMKGYIFKVQGVVSGGNVQLYRDDHLTVLNDWMD